MDKAQRVIDAYLARRGVLAANAIAKLEDYRGRQEHPARSSAPIIKKECLFAIVGGLVRPVHRDAVYLRFEPTSKH